MKRFFTSLSLKARIAFCTVALSLVTGVESVFAQDQLGNDLLNQMENSITSTSEGFFRILRIIFIIGAGISLAMVGFKVIQGDRDSMKQAGWWIVGLVVCLGGFAVLSSNIVSGV